LSQGGATSQTLWCERALVATGFAAGVVVGVEGDSIVSVAAGTPAPPPGAHRLNGVTLPGLANAHSHAFHRALRGRTHHGGGTFWSWREQMYELAGRLDPDIFEELATAAYAEMVQAGYTAVGEFHYLHHGPGGAGYADPNEMGVRLLRAAERAGMRITLLDACYLHGGIGAPLAPVQQRFSDGSVEAWAERIDALDAAMTATTARLGAAVHSVRAVDPPGVEAVAGWARARGAPLHAHVSEQPAENDDCVATYGVTPTGLLARHGALSDRFTAVHATHATTADAALLGAAAATCCVCPTTERDLADGIGPTVALRDAGVALCLGSDSHAVVDPFEETRAVELDERLCSRRRGGHRPADLLTAATVAGYRSLGWQGGGIAVGALADLVTVGLDSPRLAGCDRDDLAGALVFGATAADVRHVTVGGRTVVREGRHETIDVTRALASSIGAAWGTGR
jgi:formiminoglutamate deiminase